MCEYCSKLMLDSASNYERVALISGTTYCLLSELPTIINYSSKWWHLPYTSKSNHSNAASPCKCQSNIIKCNSIYTMPPLKYVYLLLSKGSNQSRGMFLPLLPFFLLEINPEEAFGQKSCLPLNAFTNAAVFASYLVRSIHISIRWMTSTNEGRMCTLSRFIHNQHFITYRSFYC